MTVRSFRAGETRFDRQHRHQNTTSNMENSTPTKAPKPQKPKKNPTSPFTPPRDLDGSRGGFRGRGSMTSPKRGSYRGGRGRGGSNPSSPSSRHFGTSPCASNCDITPKFRCKRYPFMCEFSFLSSGKAFQCLQFLPTIFATLHVPWRFLFPHI